jgi:acetyl-CoA synthetase
MAVGASRDGVVWQPDARMRAAANLTAFMNTYGVPDYETLVRRADAEPQWFHQALIEHLGFRFFQPYQRVVDESGGPPWVRWCVGGTTNVVLNCIDRWLDTATATAPALIWEGEDREVRSYTYAGIDAETCRLAHGLRTLGIGPGDVVGVYLPNLPQAVFALLAIAKIGAISLPLFSGFGAEALATRLADGGAKAVITVDGATRRGKVVGSKRVVDEAAPRVPTLRHVVVWRHRDAPMSWIEGRDVWWQDLVRGAPARAPTEPVDAEAPMFLIYTSGTTGKPKGVVHSHCGFPLKTALDLGLCMDLKASDRLLWMSDMGWLVGPILVFGTLLLGATIVLVEGAPDYPEPDRMWRLVDDHAVSYLGIAPTVVRALMPGGDAQLEGHDLSSLRCFTSTGEVWNPDAWMWLFEKVGRRRVPVLNYSGGTEIGGIVTATVIHPLKPCCFAGPVPGTGADVVDARGERVAPGEIGELVMRRPSIGLTRGLWHDEARYLESYWHSLPGVWLHGDLASIDADGYWFIHGRSDDTLKIAGKRTGPAEVESLVVATGLAREAVAVGTPDPIKGTGLLCFCVPGPGIEPGRDAEDRIGEAVVAGLGPPFRPNAVVFVPDLPKTRNMKLMRRVVRAAWHGEDPGDLSTLVNPESVEAIAALAATGAKPSV